MKKLMINKKIILNSFFNFKKYSFFLLVFIIFFLIFIVYSNNFLLICQQGEVVSPLRQPIMHEFFILNKSLEENYAKNAFMECLSALTVFFEKSENIKPFYYKKVLGKVSTHFFSIYLNILSNDNRVSTDFKDFLKYLTDPKSQSEDVKKFVLLAEKFFVEYIELFEEEWHPKGFNAEFQSYKNHINLEEISPLSIKKNEERFEEIKKKLKFFYVYEKDGDFLISYSEYGLNRIKILNESITKELCKQYKLESSFIYDQSTDTYVYKLRNAIIHINWIQQISDRLLAWENITSILIGRDQYHNLAIISPFFEKILDIKSLYQEIEVERKLIQELIFIVYYPGASRGDVYFLKKLEESLRFLDQNKLYNKNSAYVKVYICDLREERTFKRYINFLIKGGVLNQDQFDAYRYYMVYFYDLLDKGESAKAFNLKQTDLENKLYATSNFLKKARRLEHRLAIEYLSEDTVLEIKKKKDYYVDFLKKTTTSRRAWRGSYRRH